MNHPSEVEFRPLHIPADIDADDAADFREMVRVRNDVYREINGNDDDTIAPATLLPMYRSDPDEIRKIWIIVKSGEVIGRVGADIPLEEGSRVVFWLVEILEDHHGQGIGSAAYRLVEETARQHGRTILQSWATQREAEGPRLEAPTGFGSLPDDHVARFFQKHGYTLEQVERKSVFDPVASSETVERLLQDAEQKASGYRVIQWMAPTPAEYVPGYAWMKSRMSTDAPAAAMEFDEEKWDEARVRRHEERWKAAGIRVQITVAQHIESGELVAFNELAQEAEPTMPSSQWDTLVLKEHRGHKLGQLVKAAGLISWREIEPDAPKIITYNAEENRPMLDINEALGFVPASYNGAWKKVLA